MSGLIPYLSHSGPTPAKVVTGIGFPDSRFHCGTVDSDPAPSGLTGPSHGYPDLGAALVPWCQWPRRVGADRDRDPQAALPSIIMMTGPSPSWRVAAPDDSHDATDSDWGGSGAPRPGQALTRRDRGRARHGHRRSLPGRRRAPCAGFFFRKKNSSLSTKSPGGYVPQASVLVFNLT